jgi:hypothetical protein
MKSPIQKLLLGLVTSALFFTACGKKADDAAAPAAAPEAPAELTIPDAPDAAMKLIMTELANGNGGILWKAMPASYQGDVNSVVQLAGTKIDVEMYNKTFSLVGRIGQIAGKQKDFIVNTSLGQSSDEERAKMAEGIPALVQFIEVITTSDLATSAGLQSFDGQKFCDVTVSKLTKLIEELSKLSDEEGQPSLDDLRNAVVAVVESDDTMATLSFTAPGQPEETSEFTKVENRWVPTEMAADWTQSMTDAKAQLEAISPEEVTEMKPQVMVVLTMVEGVLTQIEAAETQEQFDQALQGAMMPMMGLMMMGQGFGGGSAPAPMMAPPVMEEIEAPMPQSK